jgi:hypothetical protein
VIESWGCGTHGWTWGKCFLILPCIGVTIDIVLHWMIGFIAPYTFTQLGTTGNFSATAIFTHFTVHHCTRTRVSLQQSHYLFKSHMKSSLPCLIPFFALILWLPIPKAWLHSIPLLPCSYPDRLASRNSTWLAYCSLLLNHFFWLCPFITHQQGPHRKHSLYF